MKRFGSIALVTVLFYVLIDINDVMAQNKTQDNPHADGMKVVETTVPQQNLLMVRVKCSEKEISQKLGESYGKIGAYAGKNGANMTGAPMAIYYEWAKDGFEFDAAVPFDKKLPGNDEVKWGEIKAGKVLKLKYYGDYSKIEPAYDVLKNYIKTNKKKTTGAPWEVYANDPMTEKDPANWLTEIYFPVE